MKPQPGPNYFIPALFSIGALYNPAAVSLSWLTNEVLIIVQKAYSDYLLKGEGLDIDTIEAKNDEIRAKMMKMMPNNFGQVPFQVMNVNFDSKTGQIRIEPRSDKKNEV